MDLGEAAAERAAVRVPDVTIPEVRFPDVDFGAPGVAKRGVVVPATNLGGQELAAVGVGGLLINDNPSASFLTFRGVAPELTDTDTVAADPVATAIVAFTGLSDATSDGLAFTPTGGIVGGSDPATGVLSLKGSVGAVFADFQAVPRSVTSSRSPPRRHSGWGTSTTPRGPARPSRFPPSWRPPCRAAALCG